jgi:hypothetical protein
MANETIALAWLLEHSQEYQLKIQTMSWIEKAFPGWTDVCCTLNINGNEITSWGASETADIALLKAFSEATEREVLQQDGSPTSNGFAAHLSPDKARQNAMFELIERDLFFCHFLSNSEFIPIADDKKIGWKWLPKIESLICTLDLRIRYYILGNFGILCAIDGLESKNKIGFIIGSSYKEDLEVAAISATIESLRQAYFIRRDNNGKGISLNQFCQINKPDFKDHGELALNIDYANQIAPLFSKKEASGFVYPYNELSPYEVNIFDLSWTKDGCPFYFAKAISQNAQNIFLGSPQDSAINLKRLEEFAKKQIKLSDVNKLPHPFN